MRHRRLSPCHFCDEPDHSSNGCKKYATKTERKNIAIKKKICRFCFVQSAVSHVENKETTCNCEGWYSIEHHTIFCFDRIKGLAEKIFFPKIDNILWQRFAATFEHEEQLSLAFSSPQASNYVCLKHIIASKENQWYHYDPPMPSNPDSNVFITHKLYLLRLNNTDLFKNLSSSQYICKARFIWLRDTKLSSAEFLLLLSFYTKKIKITDINSKITFSEIIKNAPNIEIIELDDTSLKIDEKTWINDLLMYKNGKNFRELNIHLNTIKFDIEKMEEFVRTKCVNDVIIRIRYKSLKRRQTFHKFADKLSKHFIEEDYPGDDDTPHLHIGFDQIFDYRCFTLAVADMNEAVPEIPSKRRKLINGQIMPS